MKKKFLVLTAMVLCLAVFAGCGTVPSNNAAPSGNANNAAAPEAWKPVTVTDDLGRSVTIEQEPKNVAVIMGSFADVWQLAGGTMVATVNDAWEDFHLELGSEVKNLGKYNAISTEMLFSVDADLVIASSNTKKQVELKDTLEAAKVPVLYFEINEFSDYLRMLKACTDITGRADLYEKNGTKIQEQIEKIKSAAADAVKTAGAPKVLFIRAAASGIHAKGSTGTVLGPMLKDLGCINIADGSELLDKLSMEVIIKEDPDMIFIVQQGNDDEGTKKTISENLTSNPAWSGLKAVKEDKVYYLEKNLYHLKPNARWAESYDKLEKILYGK
ncbi:MAG: ABC transporter substrate-binding protein [Firmicutes bacterium]|nr:ABC transporter substrate-binding protein [Bacillota bacterium]